MGKQDELLPPASKSGDIGTKNGDGESQQFVPFFSVCQPLRSVSYSDSWDMVCPLKLSPKCHASEEPEPANIPDPLDREGKQCSSPPMTNEPKVMECDPNIQHSSDFNLLDGETKQHLSPVPSSKQPNSNSDSDPWDGESKQLSLPFVISRQPQSVGAGLGNMGNTCFLNATLQCITHTVPLLLKLRSAGHSTPCSHDKDGFCSFCALKEHVNESIRSSGSVLMPARFRDNLSKISSDFRPGQQEDAHEFLRCLLDNLHKCSLDPESKGKLSSFDEDSIVKQVFGGRLRSQLSCCECGHCSDTFEPFLDLSLEIDQVDNLVDALESFTKVEKIGDSENKLTCESCKAQVSKEKQLKLDKSPDVIAFQLKRFTTLDHSIEKIGKHVVYPSELDLKPFHSNPDNEVQLRYDLYGVVEHCGLPTYGHYVCTIRSSPTTWHLMNDSLVTSITEMDALNQEAYILFYVRQGLSPWFSSLLEAKEVLHLEKTTDASPVSVLENVDRDCFTSSGEGSSSISRDRLEKDEGSSLCTVSFLPDNEAERCPCDAVDNTLERPSTPSPRHKRSFSDHRINDVFDVEQFDDEETTPLIPQLQFKPRGNKAKGPAASKAIKDPCVDKNAARLLRGMQGTRRKGLLDCLLTQREAEHKEARSCPRSEPLGKKKRKLGIPVLQH